MAQANPKSEPAGQEAVAAYKRILATVIDRRPSGTRQRLAAALAKNRSFISQITNPLYSTPIPVNHLEVIFEICHFSADERSQFNDAYIRAHPKRHGLRHDAHRLKAHTIYLPDMGADGRNALLHNFVSDFVRQLARLLEDKPKKGKRR
ncbi:MAG: hypothetical protein H7X89_00975 [Rhizobiales bacterium]|nr:hypothetical protein [Hyphomicrobiales bacterium]